MCAASLLMQQDLPASVEIVADDVGQSSLAVCGHDESDGAVSREGHGADPGPGAARDAVAGKVLRPFGDRLGTAAVGDPGIATERTDPDNVMVVQRLRERAGIGPEVEGQGLEGEARAHHGGTQGWGEFQLGARGGDAVPLRSPQATAHGDARPGIAPYH